MDDHIRVETNKPVRLDQLSVELGGVGLSGGPSVVVADAAAQITVKQQQS